MNEDSIHNIENSSLKTKSANTYNALKSVFVDEKNCVNPSFGAFVAALCAVLLGAVLVNLWIRVINNFAYNFLGLNENSFVWSLIVALIATGILVLYITTILEENLSNQVKSNITGLTFGGTASNVTNNSPDTQDGL